MSDLTCQHPGCDAHPSKGHSIFRTSPFGEPFEGLCEKHYKQEFAEMIEDLS